MLTAAGGYSQEGMRQTARVSYVPVDGKPFRMTLGLRALDPADWIEVDAHRGSEMAQKQALLRDRHADVVAALPEGDAGSAETWRALASHVLEHFPSMYTDVEREGAHVVALRDRDTGELIDVRQLHPIDACGRIVQEDVVLMQKQGTDWVLVAASVCFPSRWRLADKVGKNLAGIHGPVPGYAEQIGNPVDVMFDKLTVGRPMWRLNWTLLDDAELHQPVADRDRPRGTVDVDPGTLLHFRVERQTLTKLPESGDIVFTIRTYVQRLAELGGPDVFANLATAMRSADPAMVAYKGWTDLLGPTLDWLDTHAGGLR